MELGKFSKVTQTFSCFEEVMGPFARTKTCTIPPYVYTGPAELNEFLNGEVWKFGTCFLSVQKFVRTRVNEAHVNTEKSTLLLKQYESTSILS